MRRNSQTVSLGVTCSNDEDVDTVRLNLLGNRPICKRAHHAPAPMAGRLEPVCELVTAADACVGKCFDPLSIVVLEEADQIPTDRMMAQISGHIAYAQWSLRFGLTDGRL